MIARFHNPVDTRFGWGSLQELASLTEHQAVALVTFPEARALGLVDRLQDLLGDRLVYVIEDVQPNPDVAHLRGTYERFWQEAGECHAVIAVGGGSAIDTAKALIVGTESSRFDELLSLSQVSRSNDQRRSVNLNKQISSSVSMMCGEYTQWLLPAFQTVASTR
ncbi:hypothetical protein PS833_05340 [Pseudomonas fluorescens]|uniref:Alcohol dehydrogenase iron-type/glycerol dehydrogenase GldA domain-containing protein n=1 Tax=Pseudomonas fluorescens TaxID=294 RepID=A0A5E7F8Y7_PSEFL|nr:hypothetical protein PS833_05340 [Pseudomonas fluorescens]